MLLIACTAARARAGARSPSDDEPPGYPEMEIHVFPAGRPLLRALDVFICLVRLPSMTFHPGAMRTRMYPPAPAVSCTRIHHHAIERRRPHSVPVPVHHFCHFWPASWRIKLHGSTCWLQFAFAAVFRWDRFVRAGFQVLPAHLPSL